MCHTWLIHRISKPSSFTDLCQRLESAANILKFSIFLALKRKTSWNEMGSERAFKSITPYGWRVYLTNEIDFLNLVDFNGERCYLGSKTETKIRQNKLISSFLYDIEVFHINTFTHSSPRQLSLFKKSESVYLKESLAFVTLFLTHQPVIICWVLRHETFPANTCICPEEMFSYYSQKVQN